MKTKSLSMFLAVMTGLAMSSAAYAIDGRTAVGMCIDSTAGGARCAWSVNDKGEVDICNKNGCVTCPSATGECTVARSRPKPGSTFPGAIVSTRLGWYEVGKNPGIDRLIPAQKRPQPQKAAEAAERKP